VRLEILYFASAREAVGRSTETVEAREGTTVRDLKALLSSLHPALGSTWGSARLAVDERFADDATALLGGERVAVIPPVAGG
jgi:molybdopterin synthase sulfur carrier subunit